MDPERIALWVGGFAERHGVLTWSLAEESVTLSAADGATADLRPFGLGVGGGLVDHSGGSSGGTVLSGFTGQGGLNAHGGVGGLAGWATPPTRLGLILVRRGGYAVGLAQGPELTAHKVGTRYVQSRTAAGGWSQQRFARRRDNQADALVGSVVEHALRVVLASPTDAMVVGGDKALVRDVLAEPRLSRLARLPRRELFDLPDPKLVVLKQALRRARAVRILLVEPGATAKPSVPVSDDS